MDERIIFGVRNFKTVRIDQNASKNTLLAIKKDVGFDEEFNVDDIKGAFQNISKNTLFKRLYWLWVRRYLRSKKRDGRRLFLLPSKTCNGEKSKSWRYFYQ